MVRKTTAGLAIGLCVLGLSCTVSTAPRKPLPKDDEPAERSNDKTSVHHQTGNDAPEISRSAGTPANVVVLWPRIIPRTEDPAVTNLATAIQSRLALVAKNAGLEVDRRPAPERVCPRPSGCEGVSLGAVLAVRDGACAVVGLVGPPGTADVELVPLAGGVDLKMAATPFRDPPENAVTVNEFEKCSDLLSKLESNVAFPGEEKLGQTLARARK
ncbi:MAG: hypothetical protein U0271_32455 [Polyangiaceae bacterium]